MSATTAPPGWHPDPSNPTDAFRWWDGTAWTAHTQQAPATAPAPAPAPAPAQSNGNPNAPIPAHAQTYGNPYGTATIPAQSYGTAYGTPPAPSHSVYPAGFGGPANVSFARQNTHSFTAIGVAALYIAIAMTSHVVLIGVIPIMMSIRAFNSRERLAPVALLAAIIAVVFAFAALR